MRKAFALIGFCLMAGLITMDSVVKLSGENDISAISRADGAVRVEITGSGSKQNPAWSPNSGSLLFTRFRNGYNVEPADLFVIDTGPGTKRLLVSDGSGNVNLPGSSWNAPIGMITFSSSRDPHDEIYLIDASGTPGDEMRITNRATRVAYEPSLSPDGQWVVFESHKLDVEDNGVLFKYRVDGSSSYISLTSSLEDCRQSNWSPAGDRILYQKFAGGRWDIWVMNTDGSDKQKVTSGAGDKTDGSFSPDGNWIVYSSDQSGLEFANLFIIPVWGGAATRLTNYSGYDGAPSWSPDGTQVAFESYPGDPDGSAGTTIWTIAVPPLPKTVIFRSAGGSDGWVLESAEDSGVGGTKDTFGTTFRLGDDAQNKQYRVLLHFNTSSLPDTAVITSATLKIRMQGLSGTNPFSTLGKLQVDMKTPFFGATAGLAIGDFQASAGKASAAAFSSTPVNNWYTATLNAAVRACINLLGTTQFRLRFAADDNNDNRADFMKFYSGDYGTASLRPTLTIKYEIP